VRIVVDLQMLAPGALNGGIKLLIVGQIRSLKERYPGRFLFTFLVSRVLASELRSAFPDWHLVCVSKRPQPLATHPGMRLSLRGRWALRHADLLYAPVWFSPFHSPRRPTVAMFVDMLHREHPEMLSGEAERVWRDEIIGYSVTTAARIQTISDAMVEAVRKHYGLPVDRLFRTYPPLRARRGETGIETAPQTRSGFLYPANFWPHKNHALLLEGYGRYRQRAGDGAWALMLTGHEDLQRKGALEAQARGLGLDARDVQFLGFIGDSEFETLWKRTGGMIFPSLYEGFAMPLIEAMHFRVPIAASNIPAIAEVSGGAALLFDPRDPSAIADAMFQLSSRPGFREELATKGAVRLQDFDSDEQVDRLAEGFISVIQESKQRAVAR